MSPTTASKATSDIPSGYFELSKVNSNNQLNLSLNTMDEAGLISKCGASLFGDVFVVVLISILISISVSHFYSRWVAPSSEKLAIDEILVTVNFDAIVKEQLQALTERVRNGDIEASDMPARTEKFTLALMDKINEQASEGKIVMRADQVLAAPANIPDLTDKLRNELRSEGVMERRSEESSKSKDAK